MKKIFKPYFPYISQLLSQFFYVLLTVSFIAIWGLIEIKAQDTNSNFPTSPKNKLSEDQLNSISSEIKKSKKSIELLPSDPKPHTNKIFDEAIKDAEDALDINKLFYNECLSLYSSDLSIFLDKMIKKSNDMTTAENQRKAYKTKIPALLKSLSETQEKIGNLHANLEAKCKQAMNQRKESRQFYLDMLSIDESEDASKAEKQISDEPNLKEIVIQIWTECRNEIEASIANHSELETTTK